MQVLVRALDIDLKISHAAHSAVDGRHLVGQHCRVRNENHVAGKPFLVSFDPGRKILAADFLLTFEYEFHIVLEQSVPYKVLESLHMHKSLALVIIGTASPDGSVVDFRLERIRIPFFERFCRLHIIMTVNQCRLICRVNDLLPEDYRIPLCREHTGLICTGLPEKLSITLRTLPHVLFVLRLRADRRYSHKREQFLEEPVLVFLNVLPDSGLV